MTTTAPREGRTLNILEEKASPSRMEESSIGRRASNLDKDRMTVMDECEIARITKSVK